MALPPNANISVNITVGGRQFDAGEPFDAGAGGTSSDAGAGSSDAAAADAPADAPAPEHVPKGMPMDIEMEVLHARVAMPESSLTHVQADKDRLRTELSSQIAMNTWQCERALVLEQELRQLKQTTIQLRQTLAARPALADLTLYVAKGPGKRFHRVRNRSSADYAVTLCRTCG